jgi:DNA repair exonuclease SbcCD ATPase subunit
VKTIPVKEVAEALGISARGVLYRREKGHLKGVLVKNERGVDEYRIYPTKEIIEGLRKLGSPLVASNEALADFEVVDQTVVPEEDKVLDSTYGEDDIVDATPATPRRELSEDNKNAANAVADQLWNGIIERFTEKLAEKDQLIGEMRADIADKDRRLLLLPDHEAIKRKAEEEANKVADIERNKAEAERKSAEEARLRAEQERKNAEAKELESEALKKQIAALQAKAAPELERQLEVEKSAKERELKLLRAQLEDTHKAKEQEVKALENRLADIEEYKKISEESQRKLDELQKALEERNNVEREKESETTAIKEQLMTLSSKLEESQKPWWKKWFSSPKETL